jgi:hypothetical protein
MTAQDSLRLYGRATELGAVAAFLERVRSGPGGTLVLAGEPGIGRSALLDRTVRDATAGAALHVRAVPDERHEPASGLRALLGSGAALLGARGRRSARVPPEPAELLDALDRRQGGGGPLLVCVDDADLWDAGSRAALGYAARRADRLPGVGLLMSVSGQRADARDLAGLPALRLRPVRWHGRTAAGCPERSCLRSRRHVTSG